MEPLAVWAILFVAGAVALFIIEVFIPSGGLLGLGSFACLIGAIVCLFSLDSTYGWIGLVTGIVLVPCAVALALKVFPHTFVGKRLILSEEQKADATVYSSDDSPGFADLLGAQGMTLNDLRPVGTVDFEGRREECLADRGVITAQTKVKVVSVEGMEIKVRPV
jgi:membrane-bound ClpP family serine protease